MVRSATWLALVAASVVVWVVVLSTLGFAPAKLGGDAWNYLAAGERLNAGHPLYALSAGDRTVLLAPPYWTVPLLAPPPIAVAWRPLALLGDPAMVLWGVAALVATVVATVVLLARGGIVVAAILAVLSPALAIQAVAGNVNGLLLGALVVAWILRRRPAIAGPLVAAAIAVKLTPVLLLAWAATIGRWRLAIAIVAALAVIGAASVAGAGIQNHLDWLSSVPRSAPAPTSIAGLLGLPSVVVVVALLGVVVVASRVAGERVSFSVAVVAAALASPALYLGTLGIAAAAAAPWLRDAAQAAPWRRGVRPAATPASVADLASPVEAVDAAPTPAR